MTDNTEREAFERVCPVPEGVFRYEDRYANREDDFPAVALMAAIYTAKWQSWQLGRAQDAEVQKDWVLVPREPTEKMLRAGYISSTGYAGIPLCQKVYAVMIDAAMPTGSETK